MSIRVHSWFLLALAAATLAGNWQGLSLTLGGIARMGSTWNGRAFRSSGEHVDAPRAMVERHLPPNADLFLLCSSADGIDAIERSIHIAASWAMSPAPVRFGNFGDIGAADAVLASAYDKSMGAETEGFDKIDKGGGMELWVRNGAEISAGGAGEAEAEGPPPPHAPRRAKTTLRELAGLLPLAAILALGAMSAGWAGALFSLLLFTLGMAAPPLLGFRPTPLFVVALSALCHACVRKIFIHSPVHSPFPSPQSLFLFFALAATLALSHTFMAPNGLGVSGGKAKLLFVSGGIPAGFFTDAARATLQPAYPPGLALATLGAYGFSGICGEWMTQLIGVCAATALLALLCRRASPAFALLALAAFLNTQTLQLATLFYAEPLMALFVLAGWERIRDSRRRDGIDKVREAEASRSQRCGALAGWLLVGAAGWFKNEGAVLFIALWLAERLCNGSKQARLPHLLAGLALPAAWHIGCRLAGAGLYDFAPLWEPDSGKAFFALAHALRLAFAEPWRFGFAWLLAIMVATVPRLRRRSNGMARVALVFGAICIVFFIGIFSLSSAPDFDWHLKTAMPRLLWTPSLLLLRACFLKPRMDADGCK